MQQYQELHGTIEETQQERIMKEEKMMIEEEEQKREQEAERKMETCKKKITTINATFKEWKTNLYSSDHNLIQKATQSIRSMLCIEGSPSPFIHRVIQAGLVPRLVSLLEVHFDKYPVIQYEAAWALTNIVAGTSDDTRAVVDCNAFEHLIRLLSSTSWRVCEQCAWVLLNITGDSLDRQEYANYALSIGCLPALLAVLKQKPRISTVKRAIGTIMNLLNASPTPAVENIRLALPCLAQTILLSVNDKAYDVETLSYACWALSCICGDASDGIRLLFDYNDVVPKLIELLNFEHYSVQIPALKSIGNIVRGNHAQTQAVIDLGILPELTSLLLHESENIRKEVCWALSNITAGTIDQIQAVIDCKHAIPRLIGALKFKSSSSSSSWSTFDVDDIFVQKEACFAIVNVSFNGTVDQILQIVAAGAIAPLCAILSVQNNVAVGVALEGLHRILIAAKMHGEAAGNNTSSSNNNETLTKVVESFPIRGGILTIISLENHMLHIISSIAKDINKEFFQNNRILIDFFLESDVSKDNEHSIASIRYKMKHTLDSGLRSYMVASEKGYAQGVDFLISNIIQVPEANNEFQVASLNKEIISSSSYSSNGIEGANYSCATKLLEQRTNFLKVLLPPV